jgi:hypothetical protein
MTPSSAHDGNHSKGLGADLASALEAVTAGQPVGPVTRSGLGIGLRA